MKRPGRREKRHAWRIHGRTIWQVASEGREFVEFEGVKLSVDAGDSRRIHRIKIELPRTGDGVHRSILTHVMTESKPAPMKGLWKWLLAIVVLMSGVAWWIQPDAIPVPRPQGHVRSLCPTPPRRDTLPPATRPTACRPMPRWKFELPPDGDDGCWYNLVFPRFNARVHCTERPVDNELSKLVQDAQSLVFGHEVAAAGIRRHALDLSDKSGMMYVLEGPVAAPIQFLSPTAPPISCVARSTSIMPPTPTAQPPCSSGWKRTFVASWNPFLGHEALGS